MKALVLKFTFTTDFLFKGFQVFDEGIITSMVSLVLMNCSKHIWNTKAISMICNPKPGNPKGKPGFLCAACRGCARVRGLPLAHPQRNKIKILLRWGC